nr:polysaccharide biosynthesis C-terminal domain-containing protein [uncultured Carboxylicivirga sp.]
MIGKLKGLFKQSFFYGVGNLIAKASGLILMPLYSFYVSKAEIGLLALYETAYMFLLMVSGWGAKGGFTRWYNEMKSDDDRKSLFFTTYSFNVLTSFLGVIITAVILYNLSIFQSVNSERVIIIFSISSLSKLLYDVPFILLKLQLKAFKQTTYLSVNILLTILFSFYFLQIKKLGFEGIFWAQLFANGITLITVIPLIFKNCLLKWHGKLLKEMIHYGYPLAISNILTLVLTISDRYILEAYYSLEAVGSFSVAIKVANVLQVIVVASFVTSYTYEYYKSINEEDNTRYHLKLFTYFMLFMVVSGLGIVLFGKEIIYILMAGKTEYFDALPVIPLLIVGLIFSGMRQVFVLPLTKYKQTRLISIVMIITGILNVGLNFLVIPRFGKEGAAFTTAISQLFAAIWFLRRVNRLETNNYEWRKVIIFLLTGAVFCTISFYIPSITIIVDILVKLLLLAGYFVLLYLLGVFEPIELLRLKEAYNKWKSPGNLIKNIKRK